MRRSIVMVAALAAAVALAAGFASSAGAYGGGASHDTWQVGFSGNCNNPSFCGEELGGFWGWVEFDRFADGTITGDAESTGCSHFLFGGGSFGAGHADVDITSAHLGPPQPDDPNYGTPGAQVFYIDHNVTTITRHGGGTVIDDPDFLDDSGIPAEAGHYSFHAPGVAFMLQVAFRPER